MNIQTQEELETKLLKLEAENSNLQAEMAEIKTELLWVDEALARRPALNKYQTRYDKICAACRTSQEAENIRR